MQSKCPQVGPVAINPCLCVPIVEVPTFDEFESNDSLSRIAKLSKENVERCKSIYQQQTEEILQVLKLKLSSLSSEALATRQQLERILRVGAVDTENFQHAIEDEVIRLTTENQELRRQMTMMVPGADFLSIKEQLQRVTLQHFALSIDFNFQKDLYTEEEMKTKSMQAKVVNLEAMIEGLTRSQAELETDLEYKSQTILQESSEAQRRYADLESKMHLTTAEFIAQGAADQQRAQTAQRDLELQLLHGEAQRQATSNAQSVLISSLMEDLQDIFILLSTAQSVTTHEAQTYRQDLESFRSHTLQCARRETSHHALLFHESFSSSQTRADTATDKIDAAITAAAAGLTALSAHNQRLSFEIAATRAAAASAEGRARTAEAEARDLRPQLQSAVAARDAAAAVAAAERDAAGRVTVGAAATSSSLAREHAAESTRLNAALGAAAAELAAAEDLPAAVTDLERRMRDWAVRQEAAAAEAAATAAEMQAALDAARAEVRSLMQEQAQLEADRGAAEAEAVRLESETHAQALALAAYEDAAATDLAAAKAAAADLAAQRDEWAATAAAAAAEAEELRKALMMATAGDGGSVGGGVSGRAMLAAAQDQVAECRRELRKASSANQRLTSQCNELQQECDRLRGECGRLRSHARTPDRLISPPTMLDLIK